MSLKFKLEDLEMPFTFMKTKDIKAAILIQIQAKFDEWWLEAQHYQEQYGATEWYKGYQQAQREYEDGKKKEIKNGK